MGFQVRDENSTEVMPGKVTVDMNPVGQRVGPWGSCQGGQARGSHQLGSPGQGIGSHVWDTPEQDSHQQWKFRTMVPNGDQGWRSWGATCDPEWGGAIISFPRGRVSSTQG